ncbi:MAG: shikimate kinase [Ignavibacteriaceae bacterium]|nr:shikimate kinase [Ignavibacteriaceae bacterium]
MTNKIYLTGFMGSGKSTIGPILANTLGWDFYDLDVVIEKKEGKKISKIFEDSGEVYFRDLEKQMLKDFAGRANIIIALGGGTITNQDNIDLLKKTGKIIYLKMSAEAAYKRLRFKRDRPILTRDGTVNLSKSEFTARIAQLLEERSGYYEQADIIINTDNLQLGFIVDEIAKILKAGK